jgi:hypothetical protein
VFLIAITVVVIFIPEPTPAQLRVFLAVLAISGAAFGVVISGILNVKATMSTKLKIGASGALAILVIFYFFNPAVL